MRDMRTNIHLIIDTQTELDLYQFMAISNKPREKKSMAILMNSDKKSVCEIAKNLGMNPDTVYDRLIHFTKNGLEGIKDKPLSGRPKKIRQRGKHQRNF